MREGRRWISAGLATLMLTVLVVSAMVSPAVGHIGDPQHLWSEHIKPRTDARYYTKTQANARYYTRTQADAAFASSPMWAHVVEHGAIVAQSGGLVVSRTAVGTYYVTFPAAVTNEAVAAIASNLTGDPVAAAVATPCGGLPTGIMCPSPFNNASTLEVRTSAMVQIGPVFGLLPSDVSFFVRVG